MTLFQFSPSVYTVNTKNHRQQNKCYPHSCLYLPISKLRLILAVAKLLAHNKISQICYCCQISSQSAAVNCSFCDNLTPLGVTFILLAMVHVIAVSNSPATRIQRTILFTFIKISYKIKREKGECLF